MNFTKPGEMLDAALSNVIMAHAGQYDKSNKPYVLHCLAVMYLLNTDDEELMCIALMHDIIEDTRVTYRELYACGFPDRVIHGIEAMTKRRGETYDEYLARVKANPDARLVKLADLQHNSDISRLKGVTEKDIKRMVKYHNAWVFLNE